MRIERAGPADAEEILALQKLAYLSEAELYNDHSIAPLTQTIEDARADFDKQTVFKATADGAIIGSVRAHIDHGTCFIGRLIVHPDHQDRGIGTQLMMAVEAHFNAAARFELFTGHKSEKNIHLYRKLGYTVFKREQVTGDLAFVYMEKPAARP